MFKKLKLSLLLLWTPVLAVAQNQIDFQAERLLVNRAGFIENFEIREMYRKEIESGTLQSLGFENRTETLANGRTLVKIDIWKEPSSFKLIFTNHDGLSYANRFDTIEFNNHARGSYVFDKNNINGNINSLRIFLQDDGLSYLDIKPDNTRQALMDVIINRIPIHRNIRVPMSFMALSTTPLARLMASTKNLVDWPSLLPGWDWEEWRLVANMANQIKPNLPFLLTRDVEDGALDSKGNFVFIESGALQNELQPKQGGFNCSGFVKWVGDGLFSPLNKGKLMDNEVLKISPTVRPTSSLSKDFPDRETFFGLDWVRNIALNIAQSQYPHRRMAPKSFDVNDIPFFNYIPDIGYPLSSLNAIFYYQAIRKPGVFYLGSINRLYGQSPTLRQHIHTVVFLPYFDEKGNYVLKIFDRNKETTLESLQQRYIGGYAHLSFVEAIENFQLPSVVNEELLRSSMNE